MECDEECLRACPEPVLTLVALAAVQDGSGKASLRLENRMVEKAFNLDKSHLKRFTEFCDEKGEFVFPLKHSDDTIRYKDILGLFKKSYTFSNLTVYAVPFSKVSFQSKSYDDTIAKPSYMNEDTKGQEVFVNGEIQGH